MRHVAFIVGLPPDKIMWLASLAERPDNGRVLFVSGGRIVRGLQLFEDLDYEYRYENELPSDYDDDDD